MQIRGDQEIYLPSRSTDRIKVLEVFRAIDPSGDVALLGEMRAPEFEGAGKALRLLQESQTKALADLTIADLAACK
jgi:DNA-binding IscR family transcriptional regulator